MILFYLGAITIGTYDKLSIMEGKLGSLVLKIQKIVELAGITVDEVKQLLTSYPFEYLEEIKKADNLTDIFVSVRKLCSPVNKEVIIFMTNHFKLSNALIAIQMYDYKEQNYRKKLLSTTFAEELKEEAKLIGRNPIPDCTIALKLKWPSIENCTVKEFEKIIKNLFLDYSQYIHLFKVDDGGCIFVTMCAPKPLMAALVKIAKTKLPYLLDIGVILLQIGDEVILNHRKEVHIIIH